MRRKFRSERLRWSTACSLSPLSPAAGIQSRLLRDICGDPLEELVPGTPVEVHGAAMRVTLPESQSGEDMASDMALTKESNQL